MKEFLKKYKELHTDNVNISLPSVENAGIIALEISEMSKELTDKERAFFIAGFQECIKHLKLQK